MKLKKADKKDEPKGVPINIRVPDINKYNEANEDTLKNIHALTVLTVKMFGRLGYQIKIMEEIKSELQKLNKTVEKP